MSQMSHALHMSHSDIASMLTRQRGSSASNALTTLTDTISTHATRLQNKACQIHADIVLAVVLTPLVRPSQQTTQTLLHAAPHDRYVRLLQQISKVINTAPGQSIYLAVIIDVDTLHPAHRQWCHNIPWCHMHIVHNTTQLAQVVDTMRSLRVCTPNYLLMPDYVHIDAAFLLRLKMLPSERVACLVRDVRNAAQDRCESNAFQLPSSFELSSKDSEQYAVISKALKLGIYAGNFDVVSVH